MMKVLGLFSGAGMLEHGFERQGFDVVASNEVDPTICQTLRANFDHDILQESIHRLSAEKIRKDYGKIDVIIGGFPCPIYSKAADIHGSRVGVRANNPYELYAKRGGELFLHYWRQVAIHQPDLFVVENVPGLLGASLVRETFRNTPCNHNKLGYYYTLYEGIMNAKDHGLPQERPRYFFIGSSKGYGVDLTQEEAFALLEEIRTARTKHKLVVGDILEDDPEVAIPKYVHARLNGAYRDRPIITEAGEDAIAPTVVAHMAKDRGTRMIKIGKTVRPYTPLEAARLQGVPDKIELQGSDSMKYVQAGNAVAVPVAETIAQWIKELV